MFISTNSIATDLPSIEGAPHPIHLLSINAFSLGVNTINAVSSDGSILFGAIGIATGVASFVHLSKKEHIHSMFLETCALNAMVSFISLAFGINHNISENKDRSEDEIFGFWADSKNGLGVLILFNF